MTISLRSYLCDFKGMRKFVQHYYTVHLFAHWLRVKVSAIIFIWLGSEINFRFNLLSCSTTSPSRVLKYCKTKIDCLIFKARPIPHSRSCRLWPDFKRGAGTVKIFYTDRNLIFKPSIDPAVRQMLMFLISFFLYYKNQNQLVKS